MAILEINNLHVEINSRTLLKQIDLEVSAGEIVAIIGPNGAGKSSLLKTVMRDIPFSQGSISINQQAVNHNLNNSQARQVAALPQFSLLSFPYTVHEVVSLARIPHSTGLAIDNQVIDETLKAMDISHLSERLYTRLSGGEKQRVQLARVLAQIWREEDIEPEQQRLLILDEPTTALDLGHQQMLMRTLNMFAKSTDNKVAVLMVLHDVNLAARYADRLLAISEGETLAFGTPKQVLNKKNLRQLFDVDIHIMPHPTDGKPMIMGI